MSEATLKRKSQRVKNTISGKDKNGFSLNGGYRNKGWVGQENFFRPDRTSCTNDPNIIKRSTINTNGLILSQRLTFYLAEKIGKDTANDLMHDVAKYALENNLTLYEVSLENEIISKHISKSELKLILDPETYIGLAVEQAQIIIKEIELKRAQLR